MDRNTLGDGSADRYEVAMADGTTHVYVKTPRTDEGAPGGPTAIFEWVGRKRSP